MKCFLEPRASAVGCRGGKFASRSVCMTASSRRSVISRPVCGGQLSVFVAQEFPKLSNVSIRLRWTKKVVPKE